MSTNTAGSRILKLYQILHEQTDEHHSLATPDLVALLAECENARLKEIMQRIRKNALRTHRIR